MKKKECKLHFTQKRDLTVWPVGKAGWAGRAAGPQGREEL